MGDQIIPIKTLHLFPVLNRLLVDLLKSLSPEDWNRPTIAPLWTVKDVAAHLLDTNIRSISSADGYSARAAQNISSYKDLVDYLNELNAIWVKAMDRVSPQQLIRMLELTGDSYVEYLKSLDPFAPSKFAVAWAGETQSANWFHIAREYTEKWHHQQQIRDAVGKPGIMGRELFYPCIDTFMRGLPHTFGDEIAVNGTMIHIQITGEAGGDWYLEKNGAAWALVKSTHKAIPDAVVSINPDTAWKVFTKGIKMTDAIERSVLRGDEKLAKKVFNMISVMA